MGLLGKNKSGKRARKAAEEQKAYLEGERQKFLQDPTNKKIRANLEQMSLGKSGFSDEVKSDLRVSANEDYGRGLRDFNRMTAKAGGGSGGVFTPGRRDRSSRLLAQNLTTQRAETMRANRMADFNIAQDNQRYGIANLPTYQEGFSSTPVLPGSYFQQKNAPNISNTRRAVGMGLEVAGTAIGAYFGGGAGAAAGQQIGKAAGGSIQNY